MLEVQLEHRIHPGLRLDLGFAIGEECGVVFGPSGTGKTSLLRLIAGLDRPEAGTLRLGGAVLFDKARGIDVPLRSRRIGMIFQDDLLFPHLDVAANIRFGLKGHPRAEAARRLEEVAALCGVGQLLGRSPATLSGGERQRVGLARALAPRPRLLLCDEPVSALDLNSRHALIERLRAVQRAEAVPMLYVTHSPAEAIALGSRLFLLRDGRLLAEGSPLDVLAAHGLGPSLRREGIRNIVRGIVAAHEPDGDATRLKLEDGPELVIPRCERPIGAALAVGVRSEDLLLAGGPLVGVSARNVIAGTVERVVTHDSEAEVAVRTGAVRWFASVVGSSVTALELGPGRMVWLVIKARSLQVLDESDS